MQNSDLTKKLRGHQINPTLQRLKIAKFVFKKHQHISAEDVFNGLMKNNQFISKATIYNTLNLFVEKGLVKQVIVDPERIIYDSNTLKHHHVYNVNTNEIIDINTNNFELNIRELLPQNTKLVSADLVIKVENSNH